MLLSPHKQGSSDDRRPPSNAETELMMQPHEIPVHWPQLPKDLPLISFLTSLLPSCGAAAESCFNLASEKDVQVQCTHTPSLPRSHLGRLVPAASLRSKKKSKSQRYMPVPRCDTDIRGPPNPDPFATLRDATRGQHSRQLWIATAVPVFPT
jgi:hypothetical protein